MAKKWYKIFVLVLVLCFVLQSVPLTLAQTGEQLLPEDLTFRKLWNHRNLFNSQIDNDIMDFEDVNATNAAMTKTVDSGIMTLSNETAENQINRLPLGDHMPFGAYDLEISNQVKGSNVGIELFKDEQNKILLSSKHSQAESGDPSFTLPVSYVDMSDVSALTVYNDQPNLNSLETTANGLKFNGATTSRGENFVPIGAAKQGFAYETTVIAQSTSYGNAILKLRKDAQNGIFLVVNAGGNFSYEIFKGGSSQGGSKTINSTNPGKPYNMRIEIDGKNLIFSRIVNGDVQATQTVDVSSVFDLSNSSELSQFEAVFGFRGGNGDFIEYSQAKMLEKYSQAKNIEFTDDMTKYTDVTPANNVTVNDGTIRFTGSTSGRAETFVPLGFAEQGVAYEVTVTGQSTSYGNAILKLRQDAQNGIFLVTNAGGNLNYEIFKGGTSQGGSKLINNTNPGKPYTMRIEVSGKNLIFSRYVNGTVQATQTVDVSSIFDLSDPKVLQKFEAVAGFRGSNADFVEYSSARILNPEADFLGEETKEIKLEVYNGGQKRTDEVIQVINTTEPWTLRADFAAESIGTGTRKGFLSIWQVINGKATLLRNNIDVSTDFSNPETVAQYIPNLYCELASESEVSIAGFNSYINSGAAQADPKPLHDETGAILKEGDTIWLGMTVRGYDIHSSYQGVYSLNLKTGELKIVGLMLFNLNNRNRYGSFHAADIIYNSMDDEWIVMPTAHNESPHSVKSGIIPQDPRTTSFQFVNVTDVKYPNQSNEEDASLIYDSEAEKWRLVMCDSVGGYQLPLYEADTWDGQYTEIARYAQSPCTGIQLQKLDGQYYVFFGRSVDNCEALRYPQMDNPIKLNIQSSPRSNNVWPVIMPIYDEDLGRERIYMLSFDRDSHGGAHSYGNVYLYEALEYSSMPEEEAKDTVENTEEIINGEIKTAQQLMQIRNNLSGNYTLKNDIDLTGIENFVPIGDSEAPFTGTFNGGNFSIKNLKISRENTNEVGLFGRISSAAKIQNLNVVNASVKGNVYVGSIVGYNEGIIENCYAYGKVTAFSAGGILAGQNIGKISKSVTLGTINSTGGDSFGGLVGVNSANVGTIDLNNKGVIETSCSYGTVNGTNNAGGLVGHNDCGKITDSYSAGDVSGRAYVGGLVGHSGKNYSNNSTSPITNCYSISSVKGEYSVGGFAGHNEGTITQSFSDGETEGDRNVGGFIGTNNNKADIKSAYTSGIVSGENENIGTIIGWNRGAYTTIASAAEGIIIGNSKLSVMSGEAESEMFLRASTYSGKLSGFNTSVWTIENDKYPQLAGIIIPEEPVLNTEINLYTENTAAKAEFTVSNKTDEDIKAILIIASYDDSGKMIDFEINESTVTSGEVKNQLLTIDTDDAAKVKAFIWGNNNLEFNDVYPLIDAEEITF